MEFKARILADEKCLCGKRRGDELLIHVDNGNTIVSGLRRNGLGYNYHITTEIKSMRVVITGGNLRDGEYMVRQMTPSQIYETIRDGFTVTASGFQD